MFMAVISHTFWFGINVVLKGFCSFHNMIHCITSNTKRQLQQLYIVWGNRTSLGYSTINGLNWSLLISLTVYKLWLLFVHIQFAVYLVHDAVWVQYYAASFLSCIVCKCSATHIVSLKSLITLTFCLRLQHLTVSVTHRDDSYNNFIYYTCRINFTKFLMIINITLFFRDTWARCCDKQCMSVNIMCVGKCDDLGLPDSSACCGSLWQCEDGQAAAGFEVWGQCKGTGMSR